LAAGTIDINTKSAVDNFVKCGRIVGVLWHDYRVAGD